MLVRLTQWQPRPGTSREEALAAWAEHARLVERIPGIRGYVQNHAVVAPDGSEPAYAGLGEVWFDDEAAARAALATDEWAAVIEDVGRFMDMTTIVAVWAERRVARDA